MEEIKNKFYLNLENEEKKEEFKILFQQEGTNNESEIIDDDFNKKLKEFIEFQKDNDEIDLSFVCFHTEVSQQIFNMQNNINLENYIFYKELHLENCIFYKKAYFSDTVFKEKIFFEGATFKDWSNFNRCIFEQECNFESVKFKKETEFKDVTFKQDIKFATAKFDKFVSFEKAKFHKYVDFENIIAKELFYFYDVSLGKINLIGAHIENANFLILKDKDTNVLSKNNFENKDSARMIKAHFEDSNNPSDANTYFVIEQEFYLELLKKEDTTFPNRWINLISLFFNKYISNYGTDWVRVLIVLFGFGFLAGFVYSFFENCLYFITYRLWFIFGIIYTILLYWSYDRHLKELFFSLIVSYIIIFVILPDLRKLTNSIATLINPLNIFKPNKEYFKEIVLYGIFVKATVSTLVYQFVISFRNSTRRK